MSTKRRSRPSSPIEVAQSKTLDAFNQLLRDQLKPVIGVAGLKRIREDLAICTSVGGGVIVQAPLTFPKDFNRKRLRRKPVVLAVLANTIPLIDPVTLNTLKPGAYLWALRRVSGDVVAFDFFNERGAPALSTLAREKDDAGTDGPEDPGIDLDIVWGGGDTLVPAGEVYVCISLSAWKHCFFWEYPKIDWPDWF